MLPIFYIAEDIVGNQTLWFLGDNFVATTYRNGFKKAKWADMENGGTSFIKSYFEFVPYCGSKYENSEQNLLRRISNAFTHGINKRIKIPNILVVALEDDIIQLLEDDKFAVAQVFGKYIEHIANELVRIIGNRKKQLPKKARNETTIYWVAASKHARYENNELRTIFNLCLDSVVKMHDKMFIIRLKEHWNSEDELLVSNIGRLTELGVKTLWQSIDAAVKFNAEKFLGFNKESKGKKKMSTNTLDKESRGKVQSTQDGMQTKHTRVFHDPMREFFRRRSNDKYHWIDVNHKHKLPKPY